MVDQFMATWSEAEIQVRGQRLAAMAVQRWRRELMESH